MHLAVWKYYQRLAERYDAPHAHPFVSRFDLLVQDIEKHWPTDRQMRQQVAADISAYKECLDLQGHPMAFRGSTHIMQRELLKVVRAAKKLVPTRTRRKAAGMHSRNYDDWFGGIVLHFGDRRCSASVYTVVGWTDTAWVSPVIVAECESEVPFTVYVPAETINNVVRLLENERVDLRYRSMLNKLEIRQGRMADGRSRIRVNVNCLDPERVPILNRLIYL